MAWNRSQVAPFCHDHTCHPLVKLDSWHLLSLQLVALASMVAVSLAFPFPVDPYAPAPHYKPVSKTEVRILSLLVNIIKWCGISSGRTIKTLTSLNYWIIYHFLKLLKRRRVEFMWSKIRFSFSVLWNIQIYNLQKLFL